MKTKKSDIINSRQTKPVEMCFVTENGFTTSDICKLLIDISVNVYYSKEKEKLNVVDYHKLKLGKHTTTFKSDDKLFVWDKKNYRLFVGKVKGVCIEVDEGADSTIGILAIKDYLNDMQIPIDIDNL